MPVAPAQLDLKLCFSISVGLVNKITLPAPCRRAPDPSTTEADNSSRLASNNRMYRPGSIVSTTDPLALRGFRCLSS
jgi:hypothetical protein